MSFNFIKTILFSAVLLIVLYALYMAYTDIFNKSNKKIEKFEEHKLKICLYKATWCSHCTSFLKSNVFEDTYASIKNKKEYSDVVFVTYDFDENKKLAEKYSVNSFPCIIAVDGNGNLLDTFDGDRYKKEELVKFVDQNKMKL